jgi:hypothetical protein
MPRRQSRTESEIRSRAIRTPCGRCLVPSGRIPGRDSVNRKPIKPTALKSGDTVAVVASASAIERAHLERGVNVLASMGFRVKVSERVLARSGILAGDDRERARASSSNTSPIPRSRRFFLRAAVTDAGGCCRSSTSRRWPVPRKSSSAFRTQHFC